MNKIEQIGFDANLDGLFQRDNPYIKHTDNYVAWNAGWLRAQPIREEWEGVDG